MPWSLSRQEGGREEGVGGREGRRVGGREREDAASLTTVWSCGVTGSSCWHSVPCPPGATAGSASLPVPYTGKHLPQNEPHSFLRTPERPSGAAGYWEAEVKKTGHLWRDWPRIRTHGFW